MSNLFYKKNKFEGRNMTNENEKAFEEFFKQYQSLYDKLDEEFRESFKEDVKSYFLTPKWVKTPEEEFELYKGMRNYKRFRKVYANVEERIISLLNQKNEKGEHDKGEKLKALEKFAQEINFGIKHDPTMAYYMYRLCPPEKDHKIDFAVILPGTNAGHCEYWDILYTSDLNSKPYNLGIIDSIEKLATIPHGDYLLKDIRTNIDMMDLYNMKGEVKTREYGKK